MDSNYLTSLEKGREYYYKGDYEKAEYHLLIAMKHFPNYADIMNMLGVINHTKGQVEDAQSFFENAIKINPRYTEAAINLAVTYNEQGFYEKARSIHENAVAQGTGEYRQIEPFALGKITNMHAELGQAYAELKQTDKAIEQYREALKLNPNFIDIRTRFGQLLRDEGDLGEAIVQFKTVLEKKPDYLPALISLGATYYAQGNKTAAKENWQNATEIDPKNKTACMYLRMIDQIIAMEEAQSAGVFLEIESQDKLSRQDEEKNNDEEDLIFSYDSADNKSKK